MLAQKGGVEFQKGRRTGIILVLTPLPPCRVEGSHVCCPFLCVSLQVKVMHKQLLLFHNAISAYFAGNQQQLEQTLKQFNIKLKPPGAEKPSWLEEQ